MKPNSVAGMAAMAAAVLLTPALSAAGLSGTIVDPSGAVVPQAEVTAYLRGTTQRWSTRTALDGTYAFSDLPAGSYLVDANAADLTLSGIVSVALADTSENLSLQLAPQAVQARVVVTATGGAEPEHRVARAVDVLSGEALQERAEFSLGDALQVLPGLRVQTLGGTGALTRITIRGLRPADTAVTVDGFRFRDAATTQGDATPFLETMTVIRPERIEVLRGTGSSVYGSNAIGGVINVVSDTGGGPFRGSILAEGGGLGMARALLGLSGGLGRDSLRWSLGAQHLNAREGVADRAPARNTGLQGATQWQILRNATLTARVWGSDAYSALTETPYAAPASRLPATGFIPARPLDLPTQTLVERGLPFEFGDANLVPSLGDPDYRRTSRFFTGALRFHHQASSRASWTLSYSRVNTRRRFEDGPGGARFEPLEHVSDNIQGETDTVHVRTDLLLTAATIVSAGYEWERESYLSRSQETRGGNPVELSRTSAGQRSQSVFLQVQRSFLDNRLQVGASGRVHRFATHAPSFAGGLSPYQPMGTINPPTAWTGDVALSYFHFETNTKFRAHGGNGYRAPSIYERWGTIFFEGQFSGFGDPYLRPDRSVAFDWGIDQYLANQKLRLSATHFYTDLRQQIAFDSSGFLNPATDVFGRSSGYINTDGGTARGLELSAEAQPLRRLSVVTNYTYVNSNQRRSTVRDNDFFRTPLAPAHQFNGVTVLRITSRLDTVVDYWVTSDIVALYSRRAFAFDGARRTDVAVSYRFPLSGDREMRFYVKANNAFAHEYFENGYRTPGRWVLAGISVPF
jgi:iron complex outermembrane receptor protein